VRAFSALLAAALALTAAADEMEDAKRRWAESPHGPLLERILPPTFGARDLPEPGSAGAALTRRYCAQCHNLPNPAMHNAAKWPGIVDRMVQRMQGRGNLGPLMSEMMAGVSAPTEQETGTLVERVSDLTTGVADGPCEVPGAVAEKASSTVAPFGLSEAVSVEEPEAEAAFGGEEARAKGDWRAPMAESMEPSPDGVVQLEAHRQQARRAADA